MSPATRAGASFVIALKPTGLRQSSPIVCRRYVVSSHIGLTRTPVSAMEAPPASTRNPSPTKPRPHANFAGLEGSRDPSLIHNAAKTGASVMINSALIDWYQGAGIEKPPIEL